MGSRARTNTNSRSRGAAIVARRLARIEEDGDFEVVTEDRSQMVAEAANTRAQRRGTRQGLDLDDWLAAEDEIDQGGRWPRFARARRAAN